MSHPIVLIDSIGGNCPVQADGSINGFPFYFRARGDQWTLSIAHKESRDPVDVSCGFAEGWRYREAYGEEDSFDAGWMEHEEALKFIHEAAEVFHKEKA